MDLLISLTTIFRHIHICSRQKILLRDGFWKYLKLNILGKSTFFENTDIRFHFFFFEYVKTKRLVTTYVDEKKKIIKIGDAKT